MIETSQNYLKDSKRFGAKVGDRVTVIAAYPSRCNGWVNSWADEMNRYINRAGILVDIREEGHYINFGDNYPCFGFPWFSLKIVR